VGEEENFFHLAYAVFYVLCFCFLCFKILGLCFFWRCGGLGFIFLEMWGFGVYFLCVLYFVCLCFLCFNFWVCVFVCVGCVVCVCKHDLLSSSFRGVVGLFYSLITFTSFGVPGKSVRLRRFWGPKSRAKEHDTDRNLTRYRVGGV